MLPLRHKNVVYLYSSKNLKVLLKVQWIVLIFLSLFVIRTSGVHARSSVDMLKGYIVRERLGTPALE